MSIEFTAESDARAGFHMPDAEHRPRAPVLLQDCAGAFNDLQGRLTECNAGTLKKRVDIVKDFSRRVRNAIEEEWCRQELLLRETDSGDDISADVDDLKTAHALFMAAECSFLDLAPHDHGGTQAASTPALSFLEWLRSNFLQPTTETQLSAALRAVRGPTALADPSVAQEVWEVTSKLVIEGQPHDGGKLLSLLSAALKNREMSHFADLLASFPLLGTASSHAAQAHGAAWNAWKAQMAGFLQAGEEQRYPPFLPGHGAYNATWHCLAQVLSGNAWQDDNGRPAGLVNMPVHGAIVGSSTGGKAQPYARWYILAVCTLLYGATPPASLTRHALVRTMSECLQAVGLPVDAEVRAHGRALLPAEGLTLGHLFAAFVRIFEGDPLIALDMLPLYGADWACPLLAEVMWHCGQLKGHTQGAAAALQWQPASAAGLIAVGEGVDSPLRAHHLLAYAVSQIREEEEEGAGGGEVWARIRAYKSPSLYRSAVLFAYAATPPAVLAASGYRERELRFMLGNSAQSGTAGRNELASGLPLPVALARADGAALPPELRAVKLALLSGSAPTAVQIVDRALRVAGRAALHADDEKRLETVLALAAQVSRMETGQALACEWAAKCMRMRAPAHAEPAALSHPRLGSALHWYQWAGPETASHAGLYDWGMYTLGLLHSAIEDVLASSASGQDPASTHMTYSGSASSSLIVRSVTAHPHVLSVDGALSVYGMKVGVAYEHWVGAGSGGMVAVEGSGEMGRLASDLPVFARLLQVRQLIECLRVGWEGGAGAGGDSFHAFRAAAGLLVDLCSPAGQEQGSGRPLCTFGAASRLLRLSARAGLFHVRSQPARGSMGSLAEPAFSVAQAMSIMDRVTHEGELKARARALQAKAVIAQLSRLALAGSVPGSTDAGDAPVAAPCLDVLSELSQPEETALRALVSTVLADGNRVPS